MQEIFYIPQSGKKYKLLGQQCEWRTNLKHNLLIQITRKNS